MAVRGTAKIMKRTGKEQLTGGKRVRTYQAVYKVLCDTRNEDPRTVLAAPGLPPLILGWPTDPGAFCVSRDPQPQAQAEEWLVTLDYTSNPDIRTPPDENNVEDPCQRPAVVDRNPVQRQRVIDRDVDGKAVLNTAHDFFDPPVEREEHAPAFTIQKNFKNWPALLELAFTDSVNAADLAVVRKGLVYPAGTVKFNGLAGGEKYENGFNFWSATGSFEVNWEGWNKPVVSAGFTEKFVEGGFPYLWPILGKNGERPSKAVLLDENGRADPYRTNPVTVAVKKYRLTNFADLMALFGL